MITLLNHVITLTIKFAKTLLPPDSLDVDAAFVTSSRKQPKRLSHAGIEATTSIFRAGMRSVNPSIELSCSLLRETTQIWLLQLCWPSLTGSEGIDGPRQFGALTFHTLVEKHGVFSTTLLVGHDTLLATIPSQLMLLHLS